MVLKRKHELIAKQPIGVWLEFSWTLIKPLIQCLAETHFAVVHVSPRERKGDTTENRAAPSHPAGR